ncbi:MAG: SDR family NAD(P)-dependent oxidoreductase [Ilumatobacteraceae bacterium]
MSTFPFTAALVTGASSGIGEAFVRQLATAGIPVVAVARREDRLEALAAEYPSVEVLVADLTDRDDLARVERRVSDAGSPIDLVVNNAGFGTSGEVADLDPDRLVREVELNVVALLRLSHAAAGSMVSAGRGWIVNVSSVASFQAMPGLATYSATKAFVTSFTEALNAEVRSAGVIVTALCPGLTRTEFQAVSSAGDGRRVRPASSG